MRTVASRLRRPSIAALALLASAIVIALAALVSGGVPAGAAPATDDTPDPAVAPDAASDGVVDVIEVSGLIDPITADFVSRSVASAEADGSVALILQLDSTGAVITDGELTELARTLRGATVPVTVWVGPSGAEAKGGAAELALAADSLSIAQGSEIGDIGSQRLSVGEFGDLTAGRAEVLIDGVVDAERAEELGIVDRISPTLREELIGTAGVRTQEVEQDGVEQVELLTTTRLSQLPLPSQLLHTVASPAVAYLLLVLGLGLLLFEFFTAGVGVAGVVGAGSLVLASYGVAVLPHSGLGLGLILFSMFAFAVDVQTTVPRVWTGVGVACFVAGSLMLFTEVRTPWLTLVVGIGGMLLAMISGMPSMVRSRFATPTIGRESMIGQEGEAVEAVDPDGTVRIDGALWRARTNRATPVAVGEGVRVVAIDGPVLEVEPESGGAVDYRERRSSAGAAGVGPEGEQAVSEQRSSQEGSPAVEGPAGGAPQG